MIQDILAVLYSVDSVVLEVTSNAVAQYVCFYCPVDNLESIQDMMTVEKAPVRVEVIWGSALCLIRSATCGQQVSDCRH